MNYAVLGALNRHGRSKSMISSIRGLCLALRSKEELFIDNSDSLMSLMARYDACISRFADFLWTMTMTTDGQTDYSTPCACAWGN